MVLYHAILNSKLGCETLSASVFEFFLDTLPQTLNIPRPFIVVAFTARWQKVVNVIDAAVRNHLLNLFGVGAIESSTVAGHMVDLHF